MKKKIFVLEGPDGVGKTTLARAIQEYTKGHILHSTYNDRWSIEEYHLKILVTALTLNQYQSVVLDRWAVSEEVYGTVFRKGPSYKTNKLIKKLEENAEVVWIYCRNDNAIENHLKNKDKREEMFEDMTRVVRAYNVYMEGSKLDWQIYDYDKVDMDKFVRKICR